MYKRRDAVEVHVSLTHRDFQSGHGKVDFHIKDGVGGGFVTVYAIKFANLLSFTSLGGRMRRDDEAGVEVMWWKWMTRTSQSRVGRERNVQVVTRRKMILSRNRLRILVELGENVYDEYNAHLSMMKVLVSNKRCPS